MNSQIERPKGQTATSAAHAAALHHTGGGHDEGEHHGEKKSVLKKVKAKAKKIKDTITGHGHGHDHDEDDDDDEMDTDPDTHGAPPAAGHGINVGKEGTAKHHGTGVGERSHAPVANPAAHQVLDPATTHYVPGQEETLGWSRTGTGTQLGSEKHHGTNLGGRTAVGGHAPVTNPGAHRVIDPSTTQEESLGGSRPDSGTPLGSVYRPSEFKQTPGIGHSSGSTGDIGLVHKPKYGAILERDAHLLKHEGDDVLPAKYQAKFGDATPAGYGSTEAQDMGLGQGTGMARQHGKYAGGVDDPQHVPISKPGEYQTFDTTTSEYIPGQDATLGWSRTDTGRSRLSEEQPYAPKNTPTLAHLGHQREGALGTGGMRESGEHGEILDRPTHLETDPHAPRDVGQRRQAENYQTKVTDPTGRGTEEIGVTPILNQLGRMNINNDSNLKTTGQQEDLFIPISGQHQKTSTGTGSHDQFSSEPIPNSVFDSTIPTGHGFHDEVGQKHERMNINDDFSLKTTGQREDLFMPSSGQHQMTSTGSHDQFSPETLPTSVFDSTIPTGHGFHDEVGQKPERMNINSSLKTTGQREDLFIPSSGQHQMTSTGSHDQFSEAIPTVFDSTSPTSHGFHDEVGQKPESYTEKISSVASELASKAKLATGSVTSKLGYGETRATPTDVHLDSDLDSDVPSGYEESLSSISSPMTESKSGYGVGEERSAVGSVGDYGKKVVSTVQETIAPVYEKVAGLGSTVASKVQGSGPDHEVGSTGIAPDKGVSVKEYLAEKLKPGEDDKALSKAITEALPLHKPKENPSDIGRGDGGRNVEINEQITETDQTKKVVITGRVTESEEVANRLGKSEDVDYDGVGPGLASPGKSVMNRIMDAAGSWFNTSGEPRNQANDHTEEGTLSSDARVTQRNQSAGETRLE